MSQEEIIIPKGWIKTTIGKEIEFAYGKGLPKPERIEGDYPVYGSNGIVGTHHKFLIDFSSIVIGRKGTVGSIHKTNAKFWPTDVSFYVKINDSKKLQLDFVFYLLHFLNLPKYSQSGPKSGLNRNDVYKIECVLPPLPTQKQIVAKLDHILGELKVKKKEILSLIEQNKERIDFFEKNWMSYVIDREIENHPKRKEWQIMALDKLCSKINDGVHKTPTYTKSGIPFISVRELQNDTINFQNCRYISESEHLELIKRCNPEYNDVLLSKTGNTIGKLAIVKESQKFSLFVNTALLKPLKNKIYSEFLLFSLKTFFNKKKNLSKIKTSAQPNLPINMIKKIEILLPSLLIQKQIIQNIKSAEEKFQSQKKQFENIKNNYESKINYINHIQSSVLDSAFSGKLLN